VDYRQHVNQFQEKLVKGTIDESKIVDLRDLSLGEFGEFGPQLHHGV